MNTNSSSATAVASSSIAGVVPHSTTRKAIKKQILMANFARGTQFITWPLAFVLFRTIFSIRITGQENFTKATKPFILLSNHIAFYDSFLLRLALGFWSNHLQITSRSASWR
jgi:1-acyl-sn-glycerol-3-phosphate acyltransferase